MITVTLKQIKNAGPCTGGWAKVLKANGGTNADMDKPFPLVSILDSNSLDDTLWVIANIQELSEHSDIWREFARWCAMQNIEKIKPYCSQDDYELIVEWLEAGNPELRDKARSAAWSAARSAAGSAARSAAESAAESAAWYASMDAAESAAESAAWSARSAAGSAAWYASMAAAESAAWSAAVSARSTARSAESAAWSATRSAAESAQTKKLRELLENTK